MNNSLLLKVIKTFTRKERKRFTQLLEGSYFNKGSQAAQIVHLWRVVEMGMKKKTGNRLEKPKVYELLFPQEKFYKGKLEKLMSRLLQLAHRFIVLEKSEEELNAQLTLHQYYLEHGLELEARMRANSLIKAQDARKCTAENLHNKFRLYQNLTNQNSLKSNRREDLNLPFLLDQLDQFYLFTQLEYCLQMLTINHWIAPIDFGNALNRLEMNLQMIPDSLKENPVFMLYRQVYQLLRNFQFGNTKLFTSFLENLEQHQAACSQQQLKAFQTLARNYCIYLYYQGNNEFIRLGYQLYRKHLQEGLLYHDGKILVGTFRNVILLGIWSQEFSWVKEFIQTHEERISSAEEGPLIIALQQATLAFYEGAYDQALQLLTLDFTDPYLKLAARRLEIMIFYEQRSPIFMHRLEAYKIYIYRMKEGANLKKIKDRNRNFVDILKQIQHPKTFENAARIEKLTDKIHGTKYVAEKPWLLETLKRLKV